jgi:hypothetical protein
MKITPGMRCYYCGSLATSGEHVPPKQMFKPFECDSITVPSCDEHNSKKGGRDQAIVSALLIPLQTGRDRYPLEPQVEKAIEAALSSFERAKHSAIQTAFLKDPPSGLEDLPDLAHLAPSVNMTAWIRQLTAGIIYSGIQEEGFPIKWSKSMVWSPDWVPVDSPDPLEYADAVNKLKLNQERRAGLDSLNWELGWSAYPRSYPDTIYSFQLHTSQDRQVMVRHKFYNRYTWYVHFKASSKIIRKLREKLSEVYPPNTAS